MRTTLPYVTEAVLWWAAALGVWLLTLSSVTGQDLAIAVPTSLACGVAAVVTRRTLALRLVPDPWVARWALRQPLALVTDTVAMLALPWRVLVGRADEGRLVRVPVRTGPRRRAPLTRAAAVVLVSSTPGSVALDVDEESGELVLHVMNDSRFDMQNAVQR